MLPCLRVSSRTLPRGLLGPRTLLIICPSTGPPCPCWSDSPNCKHRTLSILTLSIKILQQFFFLIYMTITLFKYNQSWVTIQNSSYQTLKIKSIVFLFIYFKSWLAFFLVFFNFLARWPLQRTNRQNKGELILLRWRGW